MGDQSADVWRARWQTMSLAADRLYIELKAARVVVDAAVAWRVADVQANQGAKDESLHVLALRVDEHTGGVSPDVWRRRLQDWIDVARAHGRLVDLKLYPGERFDDGHVPTDEELEGAARTTYLILAGILPCEEVSTENL